MKATEAKRRRSLQRIRQADKQELTALTVLRCREHIALFPEHAPGWVNLGRTFTELHRYAEAESTLRQGLALAPRDRKHLFIWQLGHLEQARGNYRLAMKWHRRAARIVPDDASSWIYCGHIAFEQGRLKQAEKFERRALKCKEGAFEEAWFNLGGALLAQDRWEEARECYRKAIAIDPKYAIAKKRLKDVELAIAERALTSPKPSRPRKSRRARA